MLFRSVRPSPGEGDLPSCSSPPRLILGLYGIQLHHLTPNCITHILYFITLCEGYFNIHPHLGLWCSLFSLTGRIEGEGDAESECGAVKVVPPPGPIIQTSSCWVRTLGWSVPFSTVLSYHRSTAARAFLPSARVFHLLGKIFNTWHLS